VFHEHHRTWTKQGEGGGKEAGKRSLTSGSEQQVVRWSSSQLGELKVLQLSRGQERGWSVDEQSG
jgi:hypothetical protein